MSAWAAVVAIVAAASSTAPADRVEAPSVLVVGDSITWGSAAEIEARCAVDVDARRGRSTFGNLYLDVDPDWGAVQTIEAADADRWIIAIGTNDLHRLTGPADARARVDALVDATGDRADVSLVTVRHLDADADAERWWNDAVRSTPGVNVVEWAPDLAWLPDGVHPDGPGVDAFAELICEAA